MNLLILPVLIPLLTAAVCFTMLRRPEWQRWTCLLGTTAMALVGIALLVRVADGTVLALHLGDWPAPFGIVFVADALSGLMVAIAGIIGWSAVVYGWSTTPATSTRLGHLAVQQVMLAGVNGAFLTGDLFNMYVWFEVLLISSFVLLALGGRRDQLEGAMKYMVLNLMASAFFLTGLGLLYGIAGTLNMADLATKLATSDPPAALLAAMVLFLAAFGVKAGVFPLFSWLPASYHTPPFAVSALFAGLLTKVGVYALVRIFTLVFVQAPTISHGLLLWIGVLTMVTGVLGALAQSTIRRILSFHIISQIGYMVVGLALFTPIGVAAAVFYIAHHIIVKTNLFFVAGLVERLQGTEVLAQTGGLAGARPWLAGVFVVSAFSLIGIPPLSGFWAKLVVVQASLDAGAIVAVVTALIVGLLTLLSMNKIWNETFWKSGPAPTGKPTATMVIPAVLLAAITVAIGLTVAPLFDLATLAGDQLMDPVAYIDAVRRGP